MRDDWEILTPLLVHIQANLEADLGLATLSERAGGSPFQLHRLFRRVIGETPRAYVQRLRLERAAFRMLTHDSRLVDIALDCGFQGQETFIRAFRRRFGVNPGAYRDRVRSQAALTAPPAQPAPGAAYDISPTRIVRLRPQHVAFRRHVGPYEAVPESLFDALEVWARRRGHSGPPVWMGLGHDAPIATPAEQLRFDAALAVPGPFEPEGEIGCQVVPGGTFALTSHAGPYETLPAAYAAIFPRVMALAGYRPALPAVEIYHTTQVNTRYALHHTDICLPLVGLDGQMSSR